MLCELVLTAQDALLGVPSKGKRPPESLRHPTCAAEPATGELGGAPAFAAWANAPQMSSRGCDVPPQHAPSKLDLSVDEVVAWLLSMGLDAAATAAADGRCNGSTLSAMSLEELVEELNVTKLQARRIKVQLSELNSPA